MDRFIMLLLLTFSSAYGVAQGRIEVQVTGIEQAKGGELSAGIFKAPNFPNVGQQFIGQEIPITASTMQVYFDNVPPGEYALAIFQDIDQNKDLKANFVGYPLEPIGFSNNVRIRFGPPRFEDAKVLVRAGQTTVLKIQLR